MKVVWVVRVVRVVGGVGGEGGEVRPECVGSEDGEGGEGGADGGDKSGEGGQKDGCGRPLREKLQMRPRKRKVKAKQLNQIHKVQRSRGSRLNHNGGDSTLTSYLKSAPNQSEKFVSVCVCVCV